MDRGGGGTPEGLGPPGGGFLHAFMLIDMHAGVYHMHESMHAYNVHACILCKMQISLLARRPWDKGEGTP